MNLFPLLNLSLPELKPEECKVHLAQGNNSEPLDLFYSGEFEAWQSTQTQKNFGRPFVISLIQLPQKNQWLFAGCFRSLSVSQDKSNGYWTYETEELAEGSELVGRLVIDFQRSALATQQKLTASLIHHLEN